MNDQQLDEIETRAAHLYEYVTVTDEAAQPDADQLAGEDVPALVAAVRRLRADAAAEILPAWEAVYEPGNVSDYLIGYANDEAPAKAAAEAWMRSQAEVTGRLEWVPEERLATGRYDQWFELIERHDDGIDTGPGLIVRRRVADEAQPAEEPTVGPRCGNNPNARLTDGDRKAVDEFRAYLARRRAGGPPERNPFTTSEEA